MCAKHHSDGGLGRDVGNIIDVLQVLAIVDLLLDLAEVDVRDGVVAVEDTGDVLEGGAFGLDVEEVDEDELA